MKTGAARNHPRHQLDDALMTPLRLSLMAALGQPAEIDFKTLRDLLEAEDSALSKSMTVLSQRGYVLVRKGYVHNKPRTWLMATPKGRQALQRHMAAFQAIAAGLPELAALPLERPEGL